jgi:hypothetical protein
VLDWHDLCLTFQMGVVDFECGVQNSQQYIDTERYRQHSKRECSILNEVFKIGKLDFERGIQNRKQYTHQYWRWERRPF